jgi:hypothetical protein
MKTVGTYDIAILQRAVSSRVERVPGCPTRVAPGLPMGIGRLIRANVSDKYLEK